MLLSSVVFGSCGAKRSPQRAPGEAKTLCAHSQASKPSERVCKKPFSFPHCPPFAWGGALQNKQPPQKTSAWILGSSTCCQTLQSQGRDFKTSCKASQKSKSLHKNWQNHGSSFPKPPSSERPPKNSPGVVGRDFGSGEGSAPPAPQWQQRGFSIHESKITLFSLKNLGPACFPEIIPLL